jgi:GT2 family glycosyltransferase
LSADPGPEAPRITVAIPLYRSAPFYESICANIESMPTKGVEILVSDRHCLDDTLGRLRARFAGDPRVRWLAARDTLDWVQHINLLLREGRGDYWRLLPHDDLSPPGSLEALAQALDRDPQAILAYGPTKAIDAAGRPLPERDRPHPHPIPDGAPWTLGLVLDLFWDGHCDGAFKGLLRRRVVLEAGHSIEPTLDLILPERAWLFGLALLGPLRFVPEAQYLKRFHPQSTHAQWQIRGRHTASVTATMIRCLGRQVVDRRLRRLAALYLIWRAALRLGWLRPGAGPQRGDPGLPEPLRSLPRSTRLPLIGPSLARRLDAVLKIRDIPFPGWRSP